jgi:hypothetical protein
MPHPFSRVTLKKIVFPMVCLWLRLYGKLRRRRIIVYYKFPDFAVKAGAFADLLTKRGFETELCSGDSFFKRAFLKSSSDLWIGFWNELSPDLLPENYIFLNAEPLNVKRWSEDSDWLRIMKKAKQIWGYTQSNAEFIQTLNVPFRFTPFGYAPYYESDFQKNIKGKMLSQNIDVLFFGDLSERRRRMLEELKRHGMKVFVVSRANPAHGEKLDELLACSKIVLGIHYYDELQAQIADFARVDRLLSNRIFVVHEKPSALASNPAFEQNVTTCEYHAIPDTCAYFLARPEERASKAAKAHEWFKSEYALDNFIPYDDVRKLLRQI